MTDPLRITDLRSRLRDPIPWRTDKKRFGELTQSEQNEVLFYFLELIWGELQDVRAELRRVSPCA